MEFKPKSRKKKLVDVIYPFFADLAQQYSPEAALSTCRYVLSRGDEAIKAPHIAACIVIWDSHHPEETSLTSYDLLWALDMLEENISTQINDRERAYRESNNPRARMRLIQGGLSKNPDIPYVDMNTVVHEYPDF